MTSNINTYEDLVREKQELEVLLQFQKGQIRQDVLDLKEEFRPARQAVSVLGKLFTKDKSSPLISGGANMIIDLGVKALLGRAGWITKLVVPFLLKNFSSHVISDKKTGILKKLKSLFSRNGTTHNSRSEVNLGEQRN